MTLNTPSHYLLLGWVLLLGACSGGDSETADPKPVADGSTATTAGPSLGSGDIVANPSATSLSGLLPFRGCIISAKSRSESSMC